MICEFMRGFRALHFVGTCVTRSAREAAERITEIPMGQFALCHGSRIKRRWFFDERGADIKQIARVQSSLRRRNDPDRPGSFI